MSGPKCNDFELEMARMQEEYEKFCEEQRELLEQELKAKREQEERERQQRERERQQEERERQQREMQEYSQEEEDILQALLEERFEKRAQEIIAQEIDETLEEMGYDLVASMTPPLEEDKFVQTHVFEFDHGTGVQVTEANGQISMEIVGIGTNDRQPSGEEKQYLKGQMEDFCNVYDELVERLAKKGIRLSGTHYRLKPDEKYARILNISGMDKRKETQTLQTYMKKQMGAKLSGSSSEASHAKKAHTGTMKK